MTQSRHTSDELARLGAEILERRVKPTLSASDHGKYIAIAVDHDDFELDQRDISAVKRLLIRHPGAQIWMERAGYPTAIRIGRAS